MIPEPYDAWLHYLKYAFCVYSVLTLIPQSWRRIKEHARRELEHERNRRRSCPPRPWAEEATKVKRRFDSSTVVRRKTIDTISHSTLGVTKLSTPNRSSLVNNGHSQTGEHDYRDKADEEFRGSYSVAKIANEYERKAQKQKIHVASSDALRKRHTMSFFEGFKIPEVRVETQSQETSFQLNTSPAHTPAIVTTNDDTSPNGSIEETHQPLSNSMSDLPTEKIPNGDNTLNGHLSSNHSDNCEELDSPTKSTTPTFQFEVIRRKHKVGHVETVEDILVEQRFSRSLSSYSISELLKDQPPEPNIDQIINEIH